MVPLLNPADFLGKLLPMLIPPILLIREKQFPDSLKLFEEIAANSPPNRTVIGLKYLYLSRITGLVWLVWIVNISLFLVLAIAILVAFTNGLKLENWDQLFGNGPLSKHLLAMHVGGLFFGGIASSQLLRMSLFLEEVCREADRRERRAHESVLGGLPTIDR